LYQGGRCGAGTTRRVRKGYEGQEQIKESTVARELWRKGPDRKDLGRENKMEERKTIVKRRTKTCKEKAEKNKDEIKRGRKG
jgi:hypothetical protein